MDFGTLLSVAQKNEKRQEQKPCYQTKFAPPKKESKQSKNLSENIKKFLAKKEEEERQKALEEKRKKEQLLSLRDHKAQSRINKHLKVCKAANKSVLADAIDHENTAVTIAGPAQCDEDDYGYVSQEASAFYDKLMNKYSSLPPEKPLFRDDGKKIIKDIASTKDRVKQALKQQQVEESLPHKRKRKSKGEGDSTQKDDDSGNEKERDREIEKEEKPRIKKKPMPPMDFTELLKLAEKKQHEPIKIEPKLKPKPEEPERLMTKKQMKEYMKEKEWRERKEQRQKNAENGKLPDKSTNDKSLKPNLSKFSKPSSSQVVSDINNDKTAFKTLPNFAKKSFDRINEKSTLKNRPLEKSNSSNRSIEKTNGLTKCSEKNGYLNKQIDRSNGEYKNLTPIVSERDALIEERRKLQEERRKLEEIRRSILKERKQKSTLNKTKKAEDSRHSTSSSQKSSDYKMKDTVKSSKGLPSKLVPLNGVKSRPFPPSDVKSRQFPPPDVRPSKSSSSKLKVNKRRIIDEDDEEYDSELDDFIDDGPQDEEEDYSRHIQEIFNYDKSKYKYIDDEDDADMESSFFRQQKEEIHSARIGLMEDLEDMRLEALENDKKKERERLRKKLKR